MLRTSLFWFFSFAIACVLGLTGVGFWLWTAPASQQDKRAYQPRKLEDSAGMSGIVLQIKPWGPSASLEQMSDAWVQAVAQGLADVDRSLESGTGDVVLMFLTQAGLHHSTGHPEKAYASLEKARLRIKGRETIEDEWLYTIIYYQGVTALRIGENDNCVLCRGDSACILPIVPTAVHTNPAGSRLAIQHFTEYLHQFPDDLEVKWLLNLAHMTLGEHPDKVDSRHRLSLDPFLKSEFDIGQFRDVSHQVGLTRLNQAGGGIMEDFDNDGWLDLVVTSSDPSEPMAYFRNKGDGTFEDRTKEAGLSEQKGGLNCVQVDYNNDGHMDIFIPRGAWLPAHLAMRPSLLRNNGNGTFTDVTREAGLLKAVNSISATWADFDNDGFIDLFVCCENQPSLLYRNKGDGTFEEVAARAGVQGPEGGVKGAAWIDFDNDGYPDLFFNSLGGTAQLFHNNRDGTFTDVTRAMGINGPVKGFSCWAFDFDNDGWLDIFATCYDRTLEDIVKGLIGQQHGRYTSRLYRNLGGKGFQDVTREAGLDQVYSTMGSNFGDIDNDGYLDFYLGTGEPHLSTLVPNRLFKNVAGRRFSEITASTRHRASAKRPRRGVRRLGPQRHGRYFHRNRRGRPRRPVSQRAVAEPRSGEQLAVGETGRQEDQPSRHRRSHQGGDRRRETDHGPPARLFRQQLRGQPSGTALRPGEGRPRGPAGDLLADERHNANLPRYRRESGRRGRGIREGVSETHMETDRVAEMNRSYPAGSLPLAQILLATRL